MALYDERNQVNLHAETVYDSLKGTTRFAVYQRDTGKFYYTQQVKWVDGETYAPEDGGMSGLLEKRTILLPSEVGEYESEEALLAEIEGFVRTYMVLPEEYYFLVAHYVLLTWLGDCFPALPYLRARGDTGTGKSRFLKAIGSLCYCPIFASGATTASPVFRIYEIYRRATFLFDEADWDARNDEFSEIVKILNFGYEKGVSVLRSEKTEQGVDAKAFDVFGPKILATRNVFADDALESRCLTIGLRQENQHLNHIPENIGTDFWDQALAIRNKLLRWRFDRFRIIANVPSMNMPQIHPRLRMIITPLILCREKEESREAITTYMSKLNSEVQERRSMGLEAVVLQGLLDCMEEQQSTMLISDPLLGVNVTIWDIMMKINETRELEGEEKLSARKIHSSLKTRLNVQVRKIGKKFTVTDTVEYINELATTFGLVGAPVPGAVTDDAIPVTGEYIEEPPEE